MKRFQIFQQCTPTKTRTDKEPIYHANLVLIGASDDYNEAWTLGRSLTRSPVIEDITHPTPKEYV